MRYFSITCPQRALRLFSSVQHTLNRQTPPNSLKRREFDEIYSPLKSQNFDAIKPHKYKSILWGPRVIFSAGIKIPTPIKQRLHGERAALCVVFYVLLICYTFAD